MNNLAAELNELSLRGELEKDCITDFYTESLIKEVITPYMIYNGYLEGSLPIIENPKVDLIDKGSFNACAGTIYNHNLQFRVKATLQAYCDFIQLITKDKISNIALYEELSVLADSAVLLVTEQELINCGAINPKNVYNFVFSIASGIYNNTVDFLYRYGIKITDKLYNDLTTANMVLSDALSSDLQTILYDYNHVYKPYRESCEKSLITE